MKIFFYLKYDRKELIEEYDELKEKSRLRELKANWKIKRLALSEKRQLFLESLRLSEVEEVKRITSKKNEVEKLTTGWLFFSFEVNNQRISCLDYLLLICRKK